MPVSAAEECQEHGLTMFGVSLGRNDKDIFEL
jgi:hypothetical protein